MGYLSNTNAVPAMTSATTPSGVASASSEYNPSATTAWMAFDRTGRYWATSNTQTGWIKYKFPNQIIIQNYNITSHSTEYQGSPKNWTFEGSNDDTNWTVLDTQSNQTGWTASQTRKYITNNKQSYQYYRLNVNGVSGNYPRVVIVEWEMYEYIFDDKFLLSVDDETYSIYKNVKPLVPLMNAVDSSSGSVIGTPSYLTYYIWKAFDRDETTAYTTNYTPSSNSPLFIGFKFNDPVCVKRYEFRAGLRTFRFMGSNNGTSWDVLDTKNSLVSNTTTTQTFDISNVNLYTYYKIEATLATTGIDWVSIFSVQFYELKPPVLLSCTLSEQSFVQNGMDRDFIIDTNEVMNIREFIKQDATVMGSGKVFKQIIDPTKTPIKKITIK
ncbi:hypothetical protein H6F38_23250 [Paenibacillus sp. EKM208P]|nr:hypothetical protein H6F38_23250 [Paenibacillus sp. EKM208P]